MEEVGIWTVLICFTVIVLPLWLALHYGTRLRQAKLLSTESEKTMVELADVAERLTGRIENLERLLDVAAPEWRRKS